MTSEQILISTGQFIGFLPPFSKTREESRSHRLIDPISLPSPVDESLRREPPSPGPAMTQRMCRIQKALLAHRKTRTETLMLLRSKKPLSIAARDSVIRNLEMMLHPSLGDFLTSRNGPLDVAAIEGPTGLAVQFAIECRNGDFEIYLRSKLSAFRHLWRLKFEPQEIREQKESWQRKLDSISSGKKLDRR